MYSSISCVQVCVYETRRETAPVACEISISLGTGQRQLNCEDVDIARPRVRLLGEQRKRCLAVEVRILKNNCNNPLCHVEYVSYLEKK